MKRFLLSFFALTALISFSLTENLKAAENDTISAENQKVTKSKLTIARLYVDQRFGGCDCQDMQQKLFA